MATNRQKARQNRQNTENAKNRAPATILIDKNNIFNIIFNILIYHILMMNNT